MGWREERLQKENNRLMLRVVRMKRDTFKSKKDSILSTLGINHWLGLWDSKCSDFKNGDYLLMVLLSFLRLSFLRQQRSW